MGRIVIERGLQHDEVYDQYGDQIGVAVYDLDDPQVRLAIARMAESVDALVTECNSKATALQGDDSDMTATAIALSELMLYMVDKMIDLVDDALGEGFSARAIGARNKNPYDLWAVVQAVGESYGIKAKAKMDKGINRAVRRAAGTK